MIKKETESSHQKALIDWSSRFWWSPFLIHIQNEMPISWLKKEQFNYLKSQIKMGVKKGTSDLFLALPRGQYHGLWLELKAAKKRPTPHQFFFLYLMKKMQFKADWSDNLDNSIKTIENYLKLPGKTLKYKKCDYCNPLKINKNCKECYGKGIIYQETEARTRS